MSLGGVNYSQNGMTFATRESTAEYVQLERVIPPQYLWHGTGEKYTQSIDSGGLIPKSRLYVHLSGDEKTAVKVGKRHGNLGGLYGEQ